MTKGVKFALWLITLALAYLVSYLLEAITMVKAFFGLQAGISGLLLVVLLVICAIGKEDALNKCGKLLIRVLRFVVALVITSFFCFIATKLVAIEFCVAYLIMTFGQSMFNVEYVENLEGLASKISNFKIQIPNKLNFLKKRGNDSDEDEAEDGDDSGAPYNI